MTAQEAAAATFDALDPASTLRVARRAMGELRHALVASDVAIQRLWESPTLATIAEARAAQARAVAASYTLHLILGGWDRPSVSRWPAPARKARGTP